jgi:hypothetical protein
MRLSLHGDVTAILKERSSLRRIWLVSVVLLYILGSEVITTRIFTVFLLDFYVSYTNPEDWTLCGTSKARSGLKECQQVGVELVFVRVREAVGCPRVDL